MPLLRLAYATQFLIALIAVYVLWSQVGGQSHLDYMAWQAKLLLGGGAAFAVVKATAAAVSGDRAWNGKTLRWLGILLVLLVGCGLASYYVHLYVEPDDSDQQDSSALRLAPHARVNESSSCADLSGSLFRLHRPPSGPLRCVVNRPGRAWARVG